MDSGVTRDKVGVSGEGVSKRVRSSDEERLGRRCARLAEVSTVEWMKESSLALAEVSDALGRLAGEGELLSLEDGLVLNCDGCTASFSRDVEWGDGECEIAKTKKQFIVRSRRGRVRRCESGCRRWRRSGR